MSADPAELPTLAPEDRGARFVRRSWVAIAAVGVVLALALLGLRLGSDAIRTHRALRAALAEAEARAEGAAAATADRTELEAEVGELVGQRNELQRMMLPGDVATVVEQRFEGFCAAADLRYEGCSVLRARQRGALKSVPCEVRFSGSRHQVPVLLDAFYGQQEALAVTGLDLEVVNFIDDRVTGTLRFEAFQLGDPPPPAGEILQPYLPPTPPPEADHGGPFSRRTREALAEAVDRLEAEYDGLLAYESQTLARDHYLAEWEQAQQVVDGRLQAQADVALALPRLHRALTRSALGRAGFRVQPGGPVEMIAYD